MNRIYIYITKRFLIKFVAVASAISSLIFIVNLSDIFGKLDKVKEQIFWYTPFSMAALQVPAFVEDVSIFMVLVAAILTLYNLSMKSEITVMRCSGLSLWNVLFPLIISSFTLGLFFILVFNPLTIASEKKFHKMEQQLIENKDLNILAPKDGIWLRQKNILKDGEIIIIRAKMIYKENLHLQDVNLWFYDKDGVFYKKIDVRNMFLNNYFWHLEKAVINDDLNINKNIEELDILTNLKSDFIVDKIINNFEDAKSFSIFSLPGIIKDSQESGFASRKFIVYYNLLLNKPLMFAAMVIMAAVFSINNIRNKNNILYILIGIICGLILYVSSTVISAFGSSGIIPPFIATWVVTVIILTAVILAAFKKEQF